MSENSILQMRRELRHSLEAELSSATSAEDLAGSMSRAVALTESWLAEHREPAEGTAIACAAGCGSCCIVNVAVLVPEGVAIAEYLRGRLSPPEQEELLSRLKDLAEDVRWLDDEERILLRRPCVFLDGNGRCGIYPVRPFLCRSVTSTDPESCREALAMTAFGEDHPVLMNLYQKDLYDAAFDEVGKLVAESGRDSRAPKLSVLLHRLLASPQVLERWLSGAPIAP